MKILFVIYEIQDYGGIVGHTECLSQAFRELGHHTEIVLLRDSTITSYISKNIPHRNNYESNLAAKGVNNLSGWYGIQCLSYTTPDGLKMWFKYSQDFDLIIYELPVPKITDGWETVYETGVPQIAIIHDAHYEESYSHLSEVSEYLVGLVCVHPAAFNSCVDYLGPRRLICNPIRPSKNPTLKWNQKQELTVCAHIWKAWKKMHRVVAAAPHLKHTHLILGGDGIEGRYMRSKDKCKPQYRGMWDAFLKTDHEYRGLIKNEDLLELYHFSKSMIDLSYSKKFAQYGSHFNRSMVEALIEGCIPIVVNENMGRQNIFVAGEHYIPVPRECEPEELAAHIDSVTGASPKSVEKIIKNGKEVFRQYFHYHTVAREYLNFAGVK